MRRSTTALALLVAGAALFGCGAGTSSAPPPASPVTEDTSTPRPARPVLTFSVMDTRGNALLNADMRSDGSGQVRGGLVGATVLSAGPLQEGKRSWQLDGRPLADVRLEDSGKLKVKDPSGTTLWVVKVSGPDKTKVLQGEEADAYALKLDEGSTGEAKVTQGDQEVGRVRSRGEQGAKVERADGSTAFLSGAAAVPGLGLLLMERIPALLRAVLLVELVQRPPG